MKRITVIQLLILGMLLIGLSGCRSKVAFGINRSSVDRTKSAVEKIEDPERREALQRIFGSYEKEMKQIESEAVAIRQRIVEANRDYDTTREELETLYGQLNALVEKMGELIQRHSLEARSLCSEEEWKRIAGHKKAPFNFEF